MKPMQLKISSHIVPQDLPDGNSACITDRVEI
jgi:hypothetical protein